MNRETGVTRGERHQQSGGFDSNPLVGHHMTWTADRHSGFLLIVTALGETAIGLTLLFSPPLVAGLLLAATLDAPAALIVGRIAGAALLSLGGACWLARDDGPSRAGRGLVAAMLLYNCAAVGVLANAGAGVGLVGVLLWPAVALHAALAVWCIACLRSGG
jgi:hypothetical protein